MIKAVTFDLDMTLIDFLKLKKKSSDAAAKAMIKAGLKMHPDQCKKELFEHYMMDIEGDDVFTDFLKKCNQYSERILAAGINAYLKTKKNHLRPYPAVKKTLRKLKKKGIKLAIVTDAPRLKAYIRLDAMGIADLFDIVVGFEDTNKKKPNKLPFKKALELLAIRPDEALHVGDWPERDIKGAKSLGMKTCLANYGYAVHNYGKYVEPDYKINRFEELLKIIDSP